MPGKVPTELGQAESRGPPLRPGLPRVNAGPILMKPSALAFLAPLSLSRARSRRAGRLSLWAGDSIPSHKAILPHHTRTWKLPNLRQHGLGKGSTCHGKGCKQ